MNSSGARGYSALVTYRNQCDSELPRVISALASASECFISGKEDDSIGEDGMGECMILLQD